MNVIVLAVNYYSGRFTELMSKSVMTLNPLISPKIIVFDNGSSDGSLNFLKHKPSNINIISETNPYAIGSYSHGFSVDQLVNNLDLTNTDAVLLIDTDCFSLEQNWLTTYCERLISAGLDALGAPAFCPTESEDNRYLWPGFTLYSPRAIQFIKEHHLSFMPDKQYSKTNDSGQVLSDKLMEGELTINFLNRSKPLQVGKIPMEKWSIDNTVNHFFAASMSRNVKNPFGYIYGDKRRGRYITKRYKAWRMFQQKGVRNLMDHKL